jgi:hypothetical protein
MSNAYGLVVGWAEAKNIGRHAIDAFPVDNGTKPNFKVHERPYPLGVIAVALRVLGDEAA